MRKSLLLAHACRGTIGFFAASAFGVSADAQTTPATASGPANSNVIVVTGEQETTAPATVPITTQYSESTITSETLRNQSETQSLQTLLNTQPSVFAYQNGPNGVGANIYFRAFNSGQFAETIDNVAINDLFNGGVTGQASTFNSVLFIPANIDSVVLTRGINNPAVNSYNSLGGTIDFVPRMPADTRSIMVGGSYGSFNSYTVQGAINTGEIAGIKSLLQVDYRKSDGWQPNTRNDNLNVYYSGRHQAENGNTLSLIGVYDRNHGQEPFDMAVPLLQQYGGFYQYPTNEANETATDTNYLVVLDYRARVTSNVEFIGKAFTGGQNFLRDSYANPADSNSPYELPNQAENYDYWLYFPNGPTYNPKATFGSDGAGNAYHFYGYTTWAVGYTPRFIITLPQEKITVGGNVTYGTLHSREYWYGSEPVPQTLGYNNAWDEHDSRIFASVYAQDEIKLLNDAFTITPGVKYIYAGTRDSDSIGFFYPYGGAVSDTEHFVSPTIGLNYKLSENLAVSFGFGENVKFPDISAYYNDVPGTTVSTPTHAPAPVHIKPEHVDDYEIGVRFKEGEFAASADVYREDFSNTFIDQFNSATYSTQVTNGGDSRYQGVEVQLSAGTQLEGAGHISGFVNFAYNQAKFTSQFTTDSLGGNLSNADFTVYPGERVPDVPDYLVVLGAVWDIQGFRLNGQGRYIGSQTITDDQTGLPASGFGIPSYWVVDLGLTKTIKLSGTTAKISFNVDNLLNRYYFNEAYVHSNLPYVGATEFAAPAAPRSFTGRIQLTF